MAVILREVVGKHFRHKVETGGAGVCTFSDRIDFISTYILSKITVRACLSEECRSSVWNPAISERSCVAIMFYSR